MASDANTMIRFRAPLFITRHVLFALIAGGIGGIAFMLFLMEFDHFTSTEAFCTTCHSKSSSTMDLCMSRGLPPGS